MGLRSVALSPRCNALWLWLQLMESKRCSVLWLVPNSLCCFWGLFFFLAVDGLDAAVHSTLASAANHDIPVVFALTYVCCLGRVVNEEKGSKEGHRSSCRHTGEQTDISFAERHVPFCIVPSP